MWLNRNNGSSDIQRGITLCLVPQTMTREQAAAVLSGALRMCRQDAEETKQKIDQENFDAEKRRKENPEIAKYIDGASDFETKQVSDDLQRASDIDAIIKALPAKIETVDVYALMKKESQYGMPYMSHGISSTVLYKARTGVDGKYAFANAVPGDYMIWGEIDTKGLYADWLVPVTITAQPQSVDLFNDNAATIHN